VPSSLHGSKRPRSAGEIEGQGHWVSRSQEGSTGSRSDDGAGRGRSRSYTERKKGQPCWGVTPFPLQSIQDTNINIFIEIKLKLFKKLFEIRI